MNKVIALIVVLAGAIATWLILSDDQPASAVAAERSEQPTLVAQAEPAARAQASTADNTRVEAQVKQAAARANFVAGKDYRVLPTAQPTSSSPDSVEVAEVFMYSCPHCYTLEPFIESYRSSMPANVSFVRIPANFNSMARQHSRAYYAAAALGVSEDVHEAFFQEFHVRKNRLASEDALVKFFASQGIDADKFRDAMNSFSVDTNLRRSDDLARRYKITSVPSLVINGKYVTQASMAGSMPRLRQIVDYLVAKESGAAN